MNKQDAEAVNEQLFTQFFQYMFQKHIYIPPASQEAWFISSAHTLEHIDYTAECICQFIQNLD